MRGLLLVRMVQIMAVTQHMAWEWRGQGRRVQTILWSCSVTMNSADTCCYNAHVADSGGANCKRTNRAGIGSHSPVDTFIAPVVIISATHCRGLHQPQNCVGTHAITVICASGQHVLVKSIHRAVWLPALPKVRIPSYSTVSQAQSRKCKL